MTNEQLPAISELNLVYVQGMTFESGAERIYQDTKYKVQMNLWTPKKRGVWGGGERSYSIIGEEKFYDTYEELRGVAKGGIND